MFEPRGHDVMSGSILYPSTREDCDVGVLFIEVSGCLPMCGHGTIGTVTVAIEEGLVTPREPGKLAIEAPAGRVDHRIYAERPLRRSGAPVQHRQLPACRPMSRSTCRAWARSSSTSPMAAITTPSSSRRRTGRGLDGMPRERDSAPVADHPHAGAGQSRAGPSGRPAISGVTPRAVGRQAAHRPRPCAQRRVLWRQGDRPLALRHRHVGADGAAGRARASSRSATTSSTKASSAACSTAGSRRKPTVGNHRAIKPSVAGWAQVTGHNTIFVDDRDPLAHGFIVA